MKIINALFAVALLLFARPVDANQQQVLQLIDYIDVDYSCAIVDGKKISEGECR